MRDLHKIMQDVAGEKADIQYKEVDSPYDIRKTLEGKDYALAAAHGYVGETVTGKIEIGERFKIDPKEIMKEEPKIVDIAYCFENGDPFANDRMSEVGFRWVKWLNGVLGSNK